MDQLFTAEERAFRDEIRGALEAMLPADLAERTRATIHYTREEMARWNRLLNERGWAAHHWPAEFGGTGWTPIQRFIFEAECARIDAPPLSVFGVYLVGPTLYTFGSEAQKARYLPPILSGAEFWCQGYSEPDAGSDLAALRTTARRDGEGWVINGQKAWTTEGHFADLMICLARTNFEDKPQRGLSLFVVPMDAPGVRVDPVITIDGAHSVNSVFLDDVRVPAEALVGEVDKGWTYAKFLLTHERTNNAQVHRSRRELRQLRHLAGTLTDEDGRPLIEDAALRERFAAVELELRAVELTVLRVLADQTDGREPGPEASILKILGSEAQQSISGLAMTLFGDEAVLAEGGPNIRSAAAAAWSERHLFRRVVTIYAGSNEIQRNIVARSVLGM